MPPVRSESLSLRTGNSLRRKEMFRDQKHEKSRINSTMKKTRRKEERKDPELRAERIQNNKPLTIDKKRVWDDVDDDSLGMQVNIEDLRRRRLAAEQAAAIAALDEEDGAAVGGDDDESEEGYDSML